jgi:GNAT superfamily N-acetyltransferase
MEEEIKLRRLDLSDLPFADSLRQAAGWNQTLADWRRILFLDPEGCFAAIDQDTVVGTATTTSFGTDLAWIGMVLVDPSKRNRGIGRLLLGQCLEYLQAKRVRCIKLDATPAGQILYEKLGFQVEWPLARWVKTDDSEIQTAFQARALNPLTSNDWEDILQLDRKFFDADRSLLLQQLEKDSLQSAAYRGRDGRLEGFGFLRAGINADYIGPVVTRTNEAGKRIVHQFLHNSRPPVFWDIPDPCVQATALATHLGFIHQRPLVRMYLGDNHAAKLLEQPWGISDPATG